MQSALIKGTGCVNKKRIDGTEMSCFQRLSRCVIPALSAIALTLPASACAYPKEHMGISLAPGAVTPELQTLALRAQGGDKQAQLELGSYFQYAADGLTAEEQGASADRVQIANVKYANEIFEIGVKSDEMKKYDSWKLFAMTRASELYKNASLDSEQLTTQVLSKSPVKAAIAKSQPSKALTQKGLLEAAKRFAVIKDAIYRQQFETSFNDANRETCYENAFTQSEWVSSAHFIVEGKLSYSFIDPSEFPVDKRPSSLSGRRTSDHYKADIEITRFVKWPDKFPRPQKLTFKSYVYDGRWMEDPAGEFGGCLTWDPRGQPNDASAYIVLDYVNYPIGVGRFDIVKTFRN
jgi:hypothetical protein